MQAAGLPANLAESWETVGAYLPLHSTLCIFRGLVFLLSYKGTTDDLWETWHVVGM